MTEQLDAAIVEVPVRTTVQVVRQPRSRCWTCRTRRVLYRIAITANVNDGDMTEARCAPCWGLR